MIYEISCKDFASKTGDFDIKAIENDIIYIESSKTLGSGFKKSKLPDSVIEHQNQELQNQKAELSAMVNTNRSQSNTKTIEYKGIKFQATKTDQDLIANTLVSFPDALPEGFVWIAEDNTQVPITRDDLQNIAQLIAAQVSKNFLVARTLKDTIETADKSVIDSLDIYSPFGLEKPENSQNPQN